MTAATVLERPQQGESVGTPWDRIVRLSLLGTVMMLMIVIWHMGGFGANPLALVQPGENGPAAELFHRDFPDSELPGGIGLDGQQFYAMARDPLDLDKAAESLDRPAYRFQRPFYAWLAAALHPAGGGGVGLVYALVAVGLLALVGGGVAAGALSTALGGRVWPALAFPLLPGSYMSLRVSVADALAVALVIAALAFAARRRTIPAVALAIPAVLTKETMLIVLAGWAVAHRTRRDAAPLIAAAGVAGAWAAFLAVRFAGTEQSASNELVLPFTGVPHAIEHWLGGSDQIALVATLIAISAGIAAIVVGRLRHPLSWVVLLNLGFLTVLRWNVMALDFGGTRSMLPLSAFSLILLASPRRTTTEVDAAN
jgi:hypothetical protein